VLAAALFTAPAAARHGRHGGPWWSPPQAGPPGGTHRAPQGGPAHPAPRRRNAN
jgi:hypothetical protein